VTDLDIVTSNNFNYKICFTAGDNCSITLQNNVMLLNGEMPAIKPGVFYEISVSVTRYTLNNTVKTDCKMSITPFKK
jgi:hypothetical protein